MIDVMNRPTLIELKALYQDLLLNNVVPYWLKHGIDHEKGGLLTCIRDDGSKISTDKYMWSQCRGIWTFAALYNRVEPRAEFLTIARNTADFVLRQGRDENGHYAYQLSREGKHLQGATSVYSDLFAAYGLGELYRATKEKLYLEEALRSIRSIARRMESPDFNGFAPYSKPDKVGKVHGPAMIALEVAQEIADIAPEPEILGFVNRCLDQIMDYHVHPVSKLVYEHLGLRGEEIFTPAGQAVNPGHAIESMWFVIHQARRRKDTNLILRATEIIRLSLERGWDAEMGGIFLAIDAGGGKPWWPHAEKKLWWPHVEALYALLLAHELTGESWCMDWYWKVHQWSFQHFPDRKNGEWHQKLDRDGNVIDEVIALPVKDPFHLPRSIILILESLSGKNAPNIFN